MKVIVAGGGIGGLTAALSMHQVGIDVTVFEAAREIKPLGVGINILPHGARELIELGLEEEIDRFAIRTSGMSYYNRQGNLVIRQPCGLAAGYNWPQWSLHRGDLQMMLLRVFKERAGADKVVCGHALTGFHQSGKEVTVEFSRRAGGAGRTFSTTCDALVGADGLHSATRQILFPEEGRPVYAGMVLYRAAVEGPQYLDGRTMAIIGDRRLRLVIYPISSRLLDEGKGRSLLNWIGVLPMAENEAPTEDWQNLSNEERIRPRYAAWDFDWLDVPAVLSATETMFEFPVYDRDPLPYWTVDRVTLLGDAAHPLIPVSSSGAVHAIIDGRALAYALASHDDPRAGLRAYEEDRLESANEVVRASRKGGPDEVLEVARERCPDGENVHAFVSLAELQQIIDDFKETSGFGVDSLNTRPSYSFEGR